jgi:hypothetical protein
MPLFISILPKTHSKLLVETGTFRGDGVKKALQNGFTEVHSIELDYTLFAMNTKTFSASPRVHLYHGDSGTVLRTVMNKITESAVVFLDAHYCGVGSNSALGDVWIPIENEMKTLKDHEIKDHIIIVDDLMAMDNSHYDVATRTYAGSPGLEFILDAMVEINPDYKITAYIKENQLVAVPGGNAVECKKVVLEMLHGHRIAEKKKIVLGLMKKLGVTGGVEGLSLDELERKKMEFSKSLEDGV